MINWTRQKGWFPKNGKATVPITLSRQRFTVLGILGSGTLYFRFYEKTNSDAFIDFLKHAYKEYGKFYLIVDNASCHKSKKVKQFLEEMDDKIILDYLPPYTPELNPIEIQWRVMKKALGNQVFESADAMKDALENMFRAKEFPVVKTYKYLAC